MVSTDNLMGLLAVLSGMIIFKATSYIDQVENIMREYSIWVVLVGFILFFQRRKIAEKFGGRKK